VTELRSSSLDTPLQRQIPRYMTFQMAPNPEKQCSECGCFGAVEFGDVALCLGCYAEKGACCSNEKEEPPFDPPAT
jgi:hypothetical protein